MLVTYISCRVAYSSTETGLRGRVNIGTCRSYSRKLTEIYNENSGLVQNMRHEGTVGTMWSRSFSRSD